MHMVDHRSCSLILCHVLAAKHESKYPAKMSKREQDLEAEELRRKKSLAERLLFFSVIYIVLPLQCFDVVCWVTASGL